MAPKVVHGPGVKKNEQLRALKHKRWSPGTRSGPAHRARQVVHREPQVGDVDPRARATLPRARRLLLKECLSLLLAQAAWHGVLQLQGRPHLAPRELPPRRAPAAQRLREVL